MISDSSPAEKRTIPIVFRWDGGGNEVYICGSFNNWETKIPMTNRWVWSKGKHSATRIHVITDAVCIVVL